MKSVSALIGLVVLSACGLVFSPGYSSRDKQYFAEPPVVVKKDGRYVLRWRYGEMGFYFYPRYQVRSESLVFSLQGTSSTGNRSGQEQETLIEGASTISALEKGGAFWWEPDGSLTPLAIKEEANQASQPTPVNRRG